jgi:hypothetical protein
MAPHDCNRACPEVPRLSGGQIMPDKKARRTPRFVRDKKMPVGTPDLGQTKKARHEAGL